VTGPYSDDKSGLGTAGYPPFGEEHPTLAEAAAVFTFGNLLRFSLPRRAPYRDSQRFRDQRRGSQAVQSTAKSSANLRRINPARVDS
jgi:hypothetical protein